MRTTQTPPGALLAQLTDTAIPEPLRARLLAQALQGAGGSADETLTAVVRTLAAKTEKEREWQHKIALLEAGTLREATFFESVDANGLGRRVRVVLGDGAAAYPMVPEEPWTVDLQRGDQVLVDQTASMVLARANRPPESGDVARIEHRLEGGRVMLSLREFEREAYSTTAAIDRQLEAGELGPGDEVIACRQRRLVLAKVPVRHGHAHFRHLCRDPLPEVRLHDLAAPPDYLTDILRHVRRELLEPEQHRAYGLHASRSVLLTGPSGTGKTYSVLALHREIAETVGEVTGIPVAELPPRLMRMRASELHNMWYGESEKAIDRFFSEAVQLAGERTRGPDGRSWSLPLLVIAEEIDGLGRVRGDGDGVSDRVLTTLLQRFDPGSVELRDKLIVFVSTTNVAALVDAALLRRAGGRIVKFRRLDRRSFAGVLARQLGSKPIRVESGTAAAAAQPELVRAVTAWMFAPGSDPGLFEITYVGAATGVVNHRRDLVTHDLVHRAVQHASELACAHEHENGGERGLTPELVIHALDVQLRSLAEQLEPGNVAQHVALPDGARVHSVRRLPPPALSAHQIQISP